MKYYDLSYPLNSHTPTFPDEPPLKLTPLATIGRDSCNISQLTVALHTGTHIDAPLHFIKKGKTIADFAPTKFIGPATIIDARGLTVITPAVLKNVHLPPGQIVIFFTGHDRLYGTPEYFTTHPVLSPALACELVALKTKIVGLDTPGPDMAPYNVHKILLKNQTLILENLTNLNKILNKRSLEIYALPLSLSAEASLVRVIAKTT